MRTRQKLLLSFFMLVLIAAAVSPLMGQGETIITIGVPSWMVDVFRHELFTSFEEQHPGVKVVTVPLGDDAYFQSAAYDLDKHLESAQKYASYADVVYAASYNISVEATRAGYFLDLAPLINGDASFNSDDFLPKVWQSVQWDGGVWFIPASASVQLLVYDVKAFDKAGVPYPDERWTLDDFERAAKALTTYNKDGSVDVPGIQLYGPALFYYGLTGKTFYDPNVVPSVPKFDDPDLVQFLEQWSTLQKEIPSSGNFDYNKVALVLNQPWQLTNPNPDDEQQWAASLLPGGVAGLDVQGFAVSGGTTNPELAYALANFASSSPEVVNRFYGSSPARRSLIGVQGEDSSFAPMPVPKDVQAIIDRALENGIPTSELRFQDYLDMAIVPGSDAAAPIDLKTSLQEAEVKAVKALETASAKRGASTVYVLTPVPTPSFSENQIVLRFGLGNDISANRDQWNQLVSDFLAANPEVGNVDIQSQFYDQRDMDQIDCYYQPYNSVSSMNLDDYLSFDPFMDADPTFDRNDFIGPVLEQVQRDNHIWAYPIVIQPAVMWYNPELFSKSNVPSPEQGWSVDGFKDALQQLRGVMDKEDDPIFVPGSYGNTYLLMLMAAYGGIPYDYRTTPPTINFTDPTNVDAMRQVLDLAKEGYIGYQKLMGNGGMFGGNFPITDDALSTYSWRLQNRSNPDYQDPSRLANFPSGSQFIPVAYGVGAAYIQNQAQSPDACYKWISLIASRPDLVGGMPPRLSQINDPDIAAAQGEDVTALYQGFADTFQKPNVVTFPGQYGGSGNFSTYVEPLWLNKAFDNYVLNNGDLDTDLAEAETNAKAYRECASTIPELDPQTIMTQDESKAYYKQYADCAVKIDATMKSTFSYYYTES